MKRAFTLIEMLIVVAVLVTLMTVTFRITSVASDASKRNTTYARLQRLENCLSGYMATFGSYPPVKVHGYRDIYRRVEAGGQSDDHQEIDWNDDVKAWRQVKAACRSQPVSADFPFPDDQVYADMIKDLSEQQKAFAESGDDQYRPFWEDPERKAQFMAGYDNGTSSSIGRHSSQSEFSDWNNCKLFRFGLMSYLLPRYLVMMAGPEEFYDFAQWTDNNSTPSDPFTGNSLSWDDVRRKTQVENDDQRRNYRDYNTVAAIPSQSACARWIPNLAGICRCKKKNLKLYGVDISDGSGIRAEDADIAIYSPNGTKSTANQYTLDKISVYDGWNTEFFYYSPSPHQQYILWSAGPNGRTFPPWISPESIQDTTAKKHISSWTSDDIYPMSSN